LVLFNGKPIYDEFFGNNFWSLLPIIVDDIDRIEIIRGPESVIYGANAFSGVINIITKKYTTQYSSFFSKIGTPYRHLHSIKISTKKFPLYLSLAWDEIGDYKDYQKRNRRIKKTFYRNQTSIVKKRQNKFLFWIIKRRL